MACTTMARADHAGGGKEAPRRVDQEVGAKAPAPAVLVDGELSQQDNRDRVVCAYMEAAAWRSTPLAVPPETAVGWTARGVFAAGLDPGSD